MLFKSKGPISFISTSKQGTRVFCSTAGNYQNIANEETLLLSTENKNNLMGWLKNPFGTTRKPCHYLFHVVTMLLLSDGNVLIH